jgi:glycosyltransferase involved in cell wall biosynthesis
MRGLFLYRKGQLSKACCWMKFTFFKHEFFRRIYERIEHMLSVIEHGWDFPDRHSPYPSGVNSVVMTLHNSLPYDSAGYAIRSHAILTELNKNAVDVTACTRPGYPADLRKNLKFEFDEIVSEIDGVVYHRLKSFNVGIGDIESSYVNSYAQELIKLADENNANIIHAASNYLDGLSAITAARLSGRKSVYEVRGMWHFSRAVREVGYAETDHFKYCHTCEIAAAKGADAVITISGPLKDLLVNEGVDADKISIIPNAVDLHKFQPQELDSALKMDLGLREDTTVVGFVGSLTSYEGVDLIIKAVSSLNLSGYDVCLLVVGKGYAENELKSLQKRIPNPECVKFVGLVPFEEVQRYYSIIDILPFPRKDVDVCRFVPPLKILEAMAMQKNVIVSALPPLLEMVEDRKTGVVCKPDDVKSLKIAIKWLLDHPEQASTFARIGCEWVVENRSWERVGRRFGHFINSL